MYIQKIYLKSWIFWNKSSLLLIKNKEITTNSYMVNAVSLNLSLLPPPHTNHPKDNIPKDTPNIKLRIADYSPQHVV